MLGDSKQGWLFSLADGDDTSWGDLNTFYEYIATDFDPDIEECLVVNSPVWGKLQRKDFLPVEGDGFAFYHSTRATYPSGDPYKGKPRISLLGELRGIQLDGQVLDWISVEIETDVFDALRDYPIVRDDSTRSLFEDCGIKPGAVASLYYAPPPVWREILLLLRERM